MYNKLLLRQIQKNFGGVDDIPENLVALFNVISNSYDHYEKDRRMIERSIELSSKEMIELNNNLRNEIKGLEKAEQKLITSEVRLREIIDLVPHFIFAKDISGKFILANKAFADVYGCSVKDLMGRSDADFNSNQQEVEHFTMEDLKVIESGMKELKEETITDAKGNIRILSTTKIPFTASGMDTPAVLGVSIDITESKKAEEATLLLSDMISNTSEAIIIRHPSTDKIIFWNEGAEKLYGYKENEVIGVSTHEILQTRFPSSFKTIMDTFYKEEHWSGEVIHTNKNSRKIHVETSWTLRRNAAGIAIGFLEINRDITEKKNAELALIEREAQLTIATQIAKLGYWEFDVLKGIFTFNDHFYAIFKTTAEKVEGYMMALDRYAELFVYPDDRSIVVKEVADAINSTDPNFSHRLEHRIIYANGETGYISVHFYLVKDDEGRTIKTFGINQDITDRKKSEETLQRSEANLEQKNKELELKNKELEQFAYVASHDLQEPLRTTSSFAELLQQQYQGRLDERADKYLTFINQSSERMKVLIKDLLDYSRIGRKKEKEYVDCNLILQEVLDDLNAAIKETQAEINVAALPVFHGYPTEIKQLFQNLIINAIKFRKKNTPPQIKISAIKINGQWEFACNDNGIGIEEEHRERIFIIFQRLHTRNDYEGSGIGLAHCKKIVELHGGKIWIESMPGEGSTFNFTIPVKSN
jgi:PAS domain S-box-containing protein